MLGEAEPRRPQSGPASFEAGLRPAPQDEERPGAHARPGSEAKLVLLGEFGRAHGLAGEVRLKSFTEDPLAIARYGTLQAEDGRPVVVRSARRAAGDQPDMLVARVEGVGSREAAEALNRTRLFLERERLEPPAEDEFYLVDLVGLAVEEGGARVGTVVAVPDYGSGELLELALAGRGRTVLLPFTRAYVPVVDVAGGRIAIAPPDGWLDDEEAPRDEP